MNVNSVEILTKNGAKNLPQTTFFVLKVCLFFFQAKKTKYLENLLDWNFPIYIKSLIIQLKMIRLSHVYEFLHSFYIL